MIFHAAFHDGLKNMCCFTVERRKSSHVRTYFLQLGFFSLHFTLRGALINVNVLAVVVVCV